MINSKTRYRRIYWVARAIRWLSIAAMAAIAAVAVYPLISHLDHWTALPGHIAQLDQAGIAAADLRLAHMLGTLPRAVLLYGFYRLIQMMRACERGDLFSPEVPAHLQWFSTAIVVDEVLRISLPLQIAIVNALQGLEYGPVRFVVRSEQLWLMQLGLLFMVIAAIMREGATIAEDNAKII